MGDENVVTNRPWLWLRAETKLNEFRTPITPKTAKQLIQLGFRISVEESETRCIPTSLYADVGCDIVTTGSWTEAPDNAYIIGLKELPEQPYQLRHKHIYFAHCFKHQTGWSDLIQRFNPGKILDLEFLVDENSRRIAAFGKPAGIAGTAVGILAWCAQQENSILGSIKPWNTEEEMINQLKQKLFRIYAQYNLKPNILIIGSKGRSGSGAVYLARKLLLDTVEWGRKETSTNDLSKLVNQYDIVINCIHLSDAPVQEFITHGSLSDPDRKLTVCADVSCDYTHPNNPIPVYDYSSTFEKPVIRIIHDRVFDVISIDNLPSLLPLESSANYAEQLVGTLSELDRSDVWHRALDIFEKTHREATAATS